MNLISYSTAIFSPRSRAITHGVKWDYAADPLGAGLAVVDSVYSGPNYLKGDGELRHNAGVEGFLSYKPIPSVTLWGGFGFESAGNVVSKNDTITVLDLWATYAVTAETTLAASDAQGRCPPGGEGFNWLAACTRTGRSLSGTLRISGEGRMTRQALHQVHGLARYKFNRTPRFARSGRTSGADHPMGRRGPRCSRCRRSCGSDDRSLVRFGPRALYSDDSTRR